MIRPAPLLLLAFSSLALAQDITVENREAIVPVNSLPGLESLVGRPVRQAGAFPRGLLDALDIPSYSMYMGMTRNKAPESLRFHFSEVIGGVPGTQSIFEERYAIFSACRAGSCDEKGWFMIDLESNAYLGAIRHFYWGEEETRTRGSLLIFSVDFATYAEIPELYLQSLGHWAEGVFDIDRNGDTGFAIVRYVNTAESVETVCSDCLPR